jgi:hypothetical protein
LKSVPFFTTKTSGKDQPTRKIIGKHGGSVQLRSRVEPERSGTVISFSIPLPEASSRQLRATAD